MRPDLDKLLCEHERRQSGNRFHPYRRKKGFVANADGDNVPCREGMKLRYGYDAKDFGEFLSPLKGQVRKAVGRRWDSFYSDLCKNFDMSRQTSQHILVHLYQYIADPKEVYVEDGELWVRDHGYGRVTRRLCDSQHDFFVDPRDGIIKKVKKRRKVVAPEPVTVVKIGDDRELRLINGVWFDFTLKALPPGEMKTYLDTAGIERKRWVAPAVFDLLKRERVSRQQPYRTWRGQLVERGDTHYYAERRTASKKIIKLFCP